MRRKPWTEEDDQRLTALYRSGALKEELAAELGRTLLSIQDRLGRLGLLPSSVRVTTRQVAAWKLLKEQGVQLARVAQATGASPTTIRRHTGKWGTHTRQEWKASELKRAGTLYLAGVPISAIAAELGRSATSVATRLGVLRQQLGLPSRRKV